MVEDLFSAAPVPYKLPHVPGQGRKGKAFEEVVRSTIVNEGDLEYQVARARKESWAAKTVELDYRIKQGEYVEREHVRQVCATALSTVAQSLRSLPDVLERREGLDPIMADKVSLAIDDALGALAMDFEKLGAAND